MPQKKPKTALENFLCLFADVRAGEGLTVLILTLNVYLLLTAYYIIKPVREGLILAGSGPEVKSYLAAALVVVIIGAVWLYAYLAGRFSRRPLINLVTLFFAGCLVLFYILGKLNTPYLDIVFFVWVGIFNVMVIAQFWAFANDIYTLTAGKRLFAIIAFGSNLGAVFGGTIASALTEPLGTYQLLLVAAALLGFSLLLTNFVDSRESGRQEGAQAEANARIEEPIGKEGAFKLVFTNKYLLMIAVLILLLNWVNTTGEYILGRTVSESAARSIAAGTTGGLTADEFITKFYALFFTVVNVATVLIQLFLVSRILKYFGTRVALLILPIIAFGGYFIIAFLPILGIVRWVKTAENATDYSLQNTVRQVLFLPTTREQKYKAKQAIDSFFHRAGDVLSAAVVFAGANWLALETEGFAFFNMFLVLVWLVLAILIGRENKRLVAKQTGMRERKMQAEPA